MMPARPLRPPVCSLKIDSTSGTIRIRKNEVIASDQLPRRSPGIPEMSPMSSAAPPPMSSCSQMSVTPALLARPAA